MAIGAALVGTRYPAYELDYDDADTILHALGVGAGRVDEELRYVYEDGLVPLPTQLVVVCSRLFEQAGPLLGVDRRARVHGEQRLRLLRPPPPRGRVRVEGVVSGVWDKGSGAVVDTTAALSVDGEPAATAVFSSFVRGAGGFGGARGPGLRAPSVAGAPDLVAHDATRPEQALIYRLTGDLNALHVDPEDARAAGFERPILHGLCTYGFAVRMALRALGDLDPAAVEQADARFVAPVFPGDELRLELWRVGARELYGRLFAGGRERPAIDPLLLTLRPGH